MLAAFRQYQDQVNLVRGDRSLQAGVERPAKREVRGPRQRSGDDDALFPLDVDARTERKRRRQLEIEERFTKGSTSLQGRPELKTVTGEEKENIRQKAAAESLKAFKESFEIVEEAKRLGKKRQLGPFADVPAMLIPRGVPGGLLEITDDIGTCTFDF